MKSHNTQKSILLKHFAKCFKFYHPFSFRSTLLIQIQLWTPTARFRVCYIQLLGSGVASVVEFYILKKLTYKRKHKILYMFTKWGYPWDFAPLLNTDNTRCHHRLQILYRNCSLTTLWQWKIGELVYPVWKGLLNH